jgi:hypothetical protein
MVALVEMGKDIGLEAGGKRAPSKRQLRGLETTDVDAEVQTQLRPEDPI